MRINILAILLSLISIQAHAHGLKLKDFRYPVAEAVSAQRDDFSACEVSLKPKHLPSAEDRERMAATLRATEDFAKGFRQAEDTQAFASDHREDAKNLVSAVNALLAELQLEPADALALSEARLTPALVRSYLGYVPSRGELNGLIDDLRTMLEILVAQEHVTQEEMTHVKWDLALLQQATHLVEIRNPELSFEYDDLLESFMTIYRRVQSSN